MIVPLWILVGFSAVGFVCLLVLIGAVGRALAEFEREEQASKDAAVALLEADELTKRCIEARERAWLQ